MIGDGYCDDRFNLPIKGCPYDGGDCCGEHVNKLFCELCLCPDEVEVEDTCPFKIDLNNGRCNDFANIKECGYDGGDCCDPDASYDFCIQCECIMNDASAVLTQLQHAVDLTSKCPFVHYQELIGDGFCQDKLNTPACSHDGGDCKGPSKAKKCAYDNPPNGKCDDEFNIPQCHFDNGECCGEANLSDCEECKCKDPDNTVKRSITKCSYPVFKGNGKCDDDNNNVECQWDGGDCCGCFVQKGFCTECQCKDQAMLAMQDSPDWCCVQSKLNDGICHPENNIEGCFYDSLDCCLDEEGGDSICPLQGTCDIGLLKNGRCDQVNNKTDCLYDFGACLGASSERSLLCKPSLYGDSICDVENSQPQCNFDGGDCQEGQPDQYTLWLGIGVTNIFTNEFMSMNLKGQVEYFLPRFPRGLKGTSYLMHQGQPFVCGGEDEEKQVYDRCFTLKSLDSLSQSSYWLWRQAEHMEHPRTEHAAALVNPGGNGTYMWLVGGLSRFESKGVVVTELLRATELYDIQNRQMIDGVTLEFPVAGHCLMSISDDQVLLAGGYSTGDEIKKNVVLYQIDPELTVSSIAIKPMRAERKYHSCVIFQSVDNFKAVFAVGGIGYNEELEELPLTSAEAYYIALDEWVPYKPLPKNRYFSSVHAISNRVLMMGGLTDGGRQFTNYVYNHQTNWHLANFDMKGRFGHISFLMPYISPQMKARVTKQPNLLITHGTSLPTLGLKQLEFNCFRMQPEDTYCQSELTSFQEIPSTRLGSFAIAYNQDVLVCGGVNVNRQGQDSCDLLKNIKQWNFGFKQMDQPRSFAAAALGESKEWFVTGGYLAESLNKLFYGYHITDTTLIINDKWQIREGPTLPYRLAGHCMVHVEDRYFMVVGGMDESVKVANPGSFYVNYITGDYMPLPYMQQSRTNLVCLKHYTPSGDTLIIAAGGRYFHKPNHKKEVLTKYLDSTEIFSTSQKRWIPGPKLPRPLAFASSVVTPKASWIVGGRYDPLDPSMLSKYILAIREDPTTGALDWEMLGYELKTPKHSFNVLSITTENFRPPLNPDQEIIPRNYIIPKEPAALSKICDNKAQGKKAIFCPATHILVINENQVRDYKHIPDRGVLIPYSNYSYPNWPQSTISWTPSRFNHQLGTFKSLGIMSTNLLLVVGGAATNKVYARRIASTDEASHDNDLYGEVQKYHINGGVSPVGRRFWMVGGRTREGAVHSRTTVLLNNKWIEGPQMFFGGRELKLEGMCVSYLTENMGFIAGGYASRGLSELVLTYDFSMSLSDPGGWQKMPNMPGGPRYMPACTHVTLGLKSYVVLAGGINKLSESNGEIFAFSATDSTLAYDILDRVWITLDPLPMPLHSGTMVMLNSQFYMFGARDTLTTYTPAYQLELKVFWMTPNSTLWKDYFWEPIKNNEMKEDLRFFRDDNVIIPYQVCEHCLVPGY